MVKYFAKESRLIYIFVLTVIILGGGLIYLSINNISTYKELTEKQILEEEAALAEQFSVNFQCALEELTQAFENSLPNDSILNSQQIINIDTIPGIKQVILMNEQGAFLWPHFINTNTTLNKGKSPRVYLEIISIAEYHEFIIQYFEKARTNYLSALKVAKSKSDSVYVLNAVSRLYAKMQQPEKAFDNYALILSEFNSTVNSSGFPYAYFSVRQLLNLNLDTKTNDIQQLLVSFLLELSESKIPLNYSTSDLLTQILDWTTQFEQNSYILKIEELIQRVLEYITLINNYQKPIADFLNENIINKIDMSIGNFQVIKPQFGVYDEILLLNNNILNPIGVNVDLKELFDLTKQNLIQNQTKFEYQLQIVNNNGSPNISNVEMIHLSEFSPYFNHHSIEITLRKEHILEEYVFKRKLFYGIGFILLLGVTALGLILLFQNVKRERQMERLRADFVSNVTHELKTPLTSIYMFAESIYLGKATSDVILKKYSNIIVKESENLQRKINNILEFSRAENDKLEYEIQDTNLTEIVKYTVNEMSYWLEINKFKVVLNIQQDVIAQVNSEGIKQALSNLISNAIKYSGEKKKIIIRLMTKDTTAIIEVEDFGIGIPKGQLGRIFEKFYRVNSKENQMTNGTGLGLTVTKDIIEAQNGKLLVQSTLGKGSKFTIVLNG